MEGKYPAVPLSGSLTQILRDTGDHLIHPDDREEYFEFWNLNDILVRMSKESAENVLRLQCRKKMQDGRYCWVLQMVVPLRYQVGGDNIIMCFIPVSYTHLDVYKRQVLKMYCCIIFYYLVRNV